MKWLYEWIGEIDASPYTHIRMLCLEHFVAVFVVMLLGNGVVFAVEGSMVGGIRSKYGKRNAFD